MENKKEDRRVRITKQMITDAFIELVQEIPISKISVKMICETADINRSTFYAHYHDQYDLLQKTLDNVMDEIKHRLAETNLTQESSLVIPVLVKILQYAKDNSAVFKILFTEEGAPYLKESFMEIARLKASQEISDERRLHPRIADYLEVFSVAGYISIIRKWIEDGCKDSPEMLAELMARLLFRGVVSVYDPD